MFFFSLLLPLYYCFGGSIGDVKETKNRVKTGFVVAAGVYSVFSAGTCALAWPLIRAMGVHSSCKHPELYQAETVDYIRLELAGIVFGSLSKFLLLVLSCTGGMAASTCHWPSKWWLRRDSTMAWLARR